MAFDGLATFILRGANERTSMDVKTANRNFGNNSILVSCFMVPAIKRMWGVRIVNKSHDPNFQKLSCHGYNFA